MPRDAPMINSFMLFSFPNKEYWPPVNNRVSFEGLSLEKIFCRAPLQVYQEMENAGAAFSGKHLTIPGEPQFP